MKEVIARSLLAIPAQQVYDKLDEVMVIVFDDGYKEKVTKEQVSLSRYVWIIHENYPNTPLLYKHFVNAVTKGAPLDINTPIKLVTSVMEDAIVAHYLYDPKDREHLQELAFSIPNLIMNEITPVSLSHVTTIDITDFTDLADYEPIVESRAKLSHDDPFIDDTIRKVYDECKTIVANDPKLDNNNLVKAIRCGMVSFNQFVQCSVARGVPSYKNGVVMGEPILTNFTEGMYRLYDILAEGQSAAKAMDMQEDPLKDTEYFARRLQLLTMTVRSIYHGDCGSRNYTPWRLEAPKKDERGKTIYKGDLPNFVGKYYLDEENSTEEKHVYKVITEDDVHLYGQLIYLRTAYRCNHHDKYAVCSTCFGDLAKNVSRYANLGHICSATMTQQSSQSVLSTKHLDASSIAAAIILGSVAGKFFTTNTKKNAVFIKPELKGKMNEIVIPQAEALGLIDIISLDWSQVNPNRISEINTIEVAVSTKKNETVRTTVDIKQGNKSALLTMEVLAFLKEAGWQTDNRNMFVLDLTKWDFSKPVFKFPDVEYSYSDHSKQIADMIEYLKMNGSKKNAISSPDILHQELFKLVNSKLNVASSCLEVIIYALMTDGYNSYGMGRNCEKEHLGLADLIIKNRTLSTAYGYEGVTNTLTSPSSFFNHDRPMSPFDALIAPKEVVEEAHAGLR